MKTDYEKIDYYNVGIEAIDVIEKLDMRFCPASAFKYLYRSNNVRPKGDIISDLNKALYYLRRMIPIFKINKKDNIANAQKYIDLLDSTLFSTAIYDAIRYTLYASTCSSFTVYKNNIEAAMSAIEQELMNY